MISLIIEPATTAIIPLILFVADLISFSFVGSGYWLSSFYTVQIIRQKGALNLGYTLAFIAIFSIFQQSIIFSALSIIALTFISLKLAKIINHVEACCYLLSTLNIIMVSLLKWAIFGLKIGFRYTTFVLFANMICVHISLKLLTRYRLGNRF